MDGMIHIKSKDEIYNTKSYNTVEEPFYKCRREPDLRPTLSFSSFCPVHPKDNRHKTICLLAVRRDLHTRSETIPFHTNGFILRIENKVV